MNLELNREILQALKEKNYTTATEIQEKAIPEILSGKDVIAVSQTGTGKTAAFTLPLLDRIAKEPKLRKGSVRNLILVPTRELAIQVGESVKNYGKYLKVKTVTVLGGVNINPQMKELKGGADILIATPGRLLDLHSKNAVKFHNMETLILDEADKLLDMGFSDELESILSIIPKKRQTLLFSATFTNEVRELTSSYLTDPVDVRIEEEVTTASTITEVLYPVDWEKKNSLLLHLIKKERWDHLLVFAKSQNRADRLERFLLNKGLSAEALHGGKTQAARNHILERFKERETEILVATDLASRGIDIISLPVVINYDLPQVPENYIHRVGRTGRAGKDGLAISFASDKEFDDLVKIERQIQMFINREVIKGFEPKTPLKASPKIKALKPKRPKKKKRKIN